MSTVATKQAQAYIARMLALQASNIYLGLGKSTAWTDENKVPDSDPDATSLTEPLVYMKAQTVSLCKPATDKDDSAGIVFGGNKYKVVSTTGDLDPNAICVYATASFSYSDIQKELAFRQVGMFINFQPKKDVTSTVILPSQVDNVGTMLSIQNMKLANITKTSTIKVGAMYSILPIFS